jgi:hypothetical protein
MRRFAARQQPPKLADQPAPGEADVISEIVDHILAGSSREQVRHAFAGTVVYVSARPRLSESQKAAITQQLQREPVAVVAKRFGITPRHCRRFRPRTKSRSEGL